MQKFFAALFIFLALILVGCSSTIKIKFDSAGGSTVSGQTVERGEKAVRPEAPVKDGFVFDDWYLDDEIFDFETSITKGITLKAQWFAHEDVMVTFKDFDGTVLKTQTVLKGTKASPPADPTRDGYQFIGWDQNINKIISNTTITACYTVGLYTVTFQSNCEIEVASQSFYYDEIIFTLENLTLNNCLFLGWYKDNLLVENGDNFSFCEDIVLEARWQIKLTLVYSEGYPTFDDLYSDFLNDYGIHHQTTISKQVNENSLTAFCVDSNNGRLNSFYQAYQNKWEWLIEAVIKERQKASLSTIIWNGNAFNDEGALRYELDAFFRASAHYLYPITANYTTSQKQIVNLVKPDKRNVTLKVGLDFLPYERIGALEITKWFDNNSFSGQEVTALTVDLAGKTLYAFSENIKWTPAEKEQIITNAMTYLLEQFNFTIITNNLEFIQKYDLATIEWQSNKPDIISNQGIVTRGDEDVEVTLTITISFEGESEKVTVTRVVAKKALKDISSGAVVASYVYNGTYNNNKVNDYMLGTVDIIYAGFALPESNGEITLSNSYKNALNDYLLRAHEAGVRVLLCIGQEGAKYCQNFSLIARNDTLRTTFVNNIINLINQYDFDGVDIDWEYPGYNTGLETDIDKLNYTALMKDIYTAVKANNSQHLVTSAIPAGPWGYVRFDLANSSQYLDYINLMSYDLQCNDMGIARHHAALYGSAYTFGSCSAAESVDLFITQGVLASKIIIGAAFYGRYSTVTTSGPSQAGMGASIGAYNGNSKSGATITYSNIAKNYLANLGSTIKRYWDNDAKAPYIYDSVNQIVITYDDPESIGYKCDYVVNKKIGGIMYWDNGSDNTGALISALNGKLKVLKGK